MGNKSIENIINCYGCGVCAIVCPAKIISIKLNSAGFYEPKIDSIDKCLQCGLCLSICAYNDTRDIIQSDKVRGYSGWSKDSDIRKSCSSGGLGFELASHFLKRDYKALGVKYNIEKMRAEHFVGETLEEYEQSKGSKYIPSYTLTAFLKINKTDKFVITGTPCQIDSLRHFVTKNNIGNNFVLIDFFCHGVPSMLLWQKYLDVINKKIGDISEIKWRDKTNGWGKYTMYGRSMKNEVYFSKINDGDLFYTFFLGNVCLGMACYDRCKYKGLKSAADIRIGDLWGAKFSNDKEGVSGIIAFTDQGNKVISEISEECVINSEELSVVIEGQMKNRPSKPFIRKYIIKALQSKMSLSTISDTYLRFYKLCLLPKRVVRKITRMVKKYI